MSNDALPSFEQAVDQLETLIARIESGEIGLEESLRHYEDGTRLIQRCRGILDTAESRIAQLTAGPSGELTVAGESEDA